MSVIYVKEGSTAVRDATLPRDLSDVSEVTVNFGSGAGTIPTTIINNSTVGILLEQATLDAGSTYTLEFEILYPDGTEETLPRGGYDYLKVVDDLD